MATSRRATRVKRARRRQSRWRSTCRSRWASSSRSPGWRATGGEAKMLVTGGDVQRQRRRSRSAGATSSRRGTWSSTAAAPPGRARSAARRCSPSGQLRALRTRGADPHARSPARVSSNVRSRASLEVDFGPGLTILVGPNGAGKTTVLEALVLVLQGDLLKAGNVRDLINREEQYLRVGGGARGVGGADGRRRRPLTRRRAAPDGRRGGPRRRLAAGANRSRCAPSCPTTCA